MTKGHVFNLFKKEFAGTKVFSVEKNTKKELKVVLEEIENDTSRDTVYVVQADKLSVNKLYQLAVQSKHLLGSLDDNNLIVMEIQHPSLENVDEELTAELLSPIYKNGYSVMRELVLELNEEQLLQFIFHLNNKVKEIKKQIEDQKRFYEEVLQNESQRPLIENLQWVQRYHFKTVQTNLKQVYTDCFDMGRFIAHPHSCINPSPAFQRNLVWPVEKKVDFIDSILQQIPIGSFYVNSSIHNLELGEGYGKLLWDGKQRMFAIHSFIKGEFPVIINGQEVYYSQAAMFFNRAFSNTSIAVYESKFETLEEIVEAYVMINQKQIRHTDEDLELAINVLREKGLIV